MKVHRDNKKNVSHVKNQDKSWQVSYLISSGKDPLSFSSLAPSQKQSSGEIIKHGTMDETTYRKKREVWLIYQGSW